MRRIFIYIFTASILLSCASASSDDTLEKSKEQISSWVENMMESDEQYSATYNNGAVRLTTVKGNSSAEALEKGGEVAFRYAGYIFEGSAPSASNLFTTNMPEAASAAGKDLGDEDPGDKTIVLGEDRLLKGLEYGLKGVRPGEQCYIVFPCTLGYGNEQVGTIPANSALIWLLSIVSVDNK